MGLLIRRSLVRAQVGEPKNLFAVLALSPAPKVGLFAFRGIPGIAILLVGRWPSDD